MSDCFVYNTAARTWSPLLPHNTTAGTNASTDTVEETAPTAATAGGAPIKPGVVGRRATQQVGQEGKGAHVGLTWPSPRWRHTLTCTASGRVVLFGGCDQHGECGDACYELVASPAYRATGTSIGDSANIDKKSDNETGNGSGNGSVNNNDNNDNNNSTTTTTTNSSTNGPSASTATAPGS